ncbi:MAG: exopolyphosphatase [Bacteroidota bacterium]|nr:exopolyphosphatase [Bacteroidota bacterium]MDP4215674.1 exopolyphosphatase [Bacteroidota bacterium]MDP4245613.1 exopolyphosphatase [Bacteroidota bacterium]MDP4253044.1 exopolyphosphatase [Bacteroidota bacterium]MDP4260626.1 exopolyphosphatase [Bacteroidota bacterium]
MRLGAIDIGSNAARLLISDVSINNGKPEFSKVNLVRVPLRLGFDVFDKKEISPEKTDMILHTIKAYKHLLDAYGVRHLKAAATSAMRDAVNAREIIDRVQRETGVLIEVISGGSEASLIYENHIAENLDKEHAYLYIDVGGGSTELTFFAGNKLIFSASFNIGTIRLLKHQVEESQWDAMKEYIKRETRSWYDNIIAIGSGGNINKIFSLSKRKEGKPLNLELLKDYHKEFSSFSLPDRMRIYKLREDRADVIVPALQIYINSMRWANADEIYVPKIGLADGLIQHLYDDLVSKGEV